MLGWHHWLNGHEFEQSLGVGDGQGSLSSVQFSSSVVSDSLQPHGHAARQASLSITNSQSLLKLMFIESVMLIESVMPSNHLILSSPSLAFNLSQYQGLFKWVSSSHQVAKVLEFQLQHQSFQWTPRTDLLLDGMVGSPCSPRDSQESSPTKQFKSINSSALSFLYSETLTCIYE